jgi:hypothetical protein
MLERAAQERAAGQALLAHQGVLAAVAAVWSRNGGSFAERFRAELLKARTD